MSIAIGLVIKTNHSAKPTKIAINLTKNNKKAQGIHQHQPDQVSLPVNVVTS
jgi:hypothetical protein